jgi:hypothetical protein
MHWRSRPRNGLQSVCAIGPLHAGERTSLAQSVRAALCQYGHRVCVAHAALDRRCLSPASQRLVFRPAEAHGNLEWSLWGREPIWLLCPHREFVLDVDRQLAAGSLRFGSIGELIR